MFKQASKKVKIASSSVLKNFHWQNFLIFLKIIEILFHPVYLRLFEYLLLIAKWFKTDILKLFEIIEWKSTYIIDQIGFIVKITFF